MYYVIIAVLSFAGGAFVGYKFAAYLAAKAIVAANPILKAAITAAQQELKKL